MKVVIAPDSFKDSLSAREAAQAMAARERLSGKTISGLLSRSRTLGVPVFAFGGSVDQDALEDLCAQDLIGAIPLVAGEVTLTQAMQEPACVLEDAVANALVRLPISSS
jgi:glycerate kinase